ncbi:MAG: rhodanese-like domain-containing protein [Desulfobia sp.]
MARKLYVIYIVLGLSVITWLAVTGCRNNIYMSTKQESKADNALNEVTGIAEDITEIKSDYLYALVVKGPLKGHYLLVDCRPAEQFRRGTISTAVSFFSLGSEIGDNLPEDRSTEIIFFCENSRCDTDARAATLAFRHGYENVKVLQDGVSGWQESGLSLVEGSY